MEGATRINIWVNNDILEELTVVAKSKSLNRTAVINFLITEYLHKERLKRKAEIRAAEKNASE